MLTMQPIADGTPVSEQTWVKIHPDREGLGRLAARDVGDELRRLLAAQDRVRMLFAAAPSQSDMLRALTAEPGIDWSRVTAFHLDEYVGLPKDSPQTFGNWLRSEIFDLVPVGEVHIMEADDAVDRLLAGYPAKLAEVPVDIACIGIGVNGHIAFNEPSIADFEDPLAIKLVDLEEASRRQQVDDGCFPSLDDVPRQAVTLTIPTILASHRIFCVAPGPSKSRAVCATLLATVSTRWPCTVLRTHARCTLYADADSASDARRQLAG